jgi:acyl dehydratase
VTDSTRARLGASAAASPYFDDLRVGDAVADAPAITITDGHAALHQAIVGDRLRLALDANLSRRVLGAERPLAHPALVCDLAIGQSTVITQRVIANLFYRGLVLRRPVLLGDTLRTSTEVVALRENSRRPGRAPTGLAVLRVTTVDQEARPVLDFWRCAMLPLRHPERDTGHDDDVEAIPAVLDPAALRASIDGWRLDEFRTASPGGVHFEDVGAGDAWSIEGGDVVSAAPELARLALNVAMAHHDADAGGGRRLVYGGHTIGVAAGQLTRALPNLVTIVAWEACDHTAPVYEGDTLTSAIELTAAEALPEGGGLVHVRTRLRARRADGERAEVLDWRLIGVMA